MLLSSLILFSGVAAAATTLQAGSHTPEEALAVLQNRQIEYCKEIKRPYTCERSCGPGYTECGAFPHCYNPTKGETCCRNGKYCPAGYYCTDAGCCPSSKSLAECGATVKLTASPPSATTTAPAVPDDRNSTSVRTSSSRSSSTRTSIQLSPTSSESNDFPGTTPLPPSAIQPSIPSSSPASPPAQTRNAAGKLEGGILAGAFGMLAMVL